MKYDAGSESIVSNSKLKIAFAFHNDWSMLDEDKKTHHYVKLKSEIVGTDGASVFDILGKLNELMPINIKLFQSIGKL